MIDHPRVTIIPEAVLESTVRPTVAETVGDHVAASRLAGACIGYQHYARTPGRVSWFLCRQTAPKGYDRCADCVMRDAEDRAREAVDDDARHENRAKLRVAIASLRYEWSSDRWRKETARLIADIEEAVRTSPGGSGNYWLALRLLAEVD